ITVYQLLLLYELFPKYFAKMQLNIPESSDEIPDILNEIKWEIDWLLTMQDPYDGGVYHKVTSKNFCGDIMPEADNDPRYFIGKSTAATFDFAAICAVAYRVYKNFLPEFANSCLKAALYAWEWGIKNPNLQFRNPDDVVTGEYGDTRLKDEQAWAAYELFIATGDSSFYNSGKKITLYSSIPSWQNVGMLGLFSMSILREDSTAKNIIVSKADELIEKISTHPYRIPITNEFYWGSNSVVANQGMILLIAFILSKDVKYLEGAMHACDYLLGRNGVGYCFVTGYGKKSPLNPHHRPSSADNVLAPIPGFLVGGPNDMSSREGESCRKEYSQFSAKAWLDDKCSFTTNEVAINWNSAIAFLAGGIDAIFNSEGSGPKQLIEKYGKKNNADFITVDIVDIKSDRVRIQWETKGNSSVSAAISKDRSSNLAYKIYIGEGKRGEEILRGLLPSTLYYVKCKSVDINSNIAETIDSFYTSPSSLDIYSAINHRKTIENNNLILNFDLTDDFNAFLIYRKGGINREDTIAFSKESEFYKVIIPLSNIPPEGIIYRIFLTNESDTIETTNFSFYLSNVLLAKKQFSLPKVYQLVSIPGNFLQFSSLDFFKSFAGDTSSWRFFGYRSKEGSYVVFDSLISGRGGWLYHKSGFDIELKTSILPPDTLYSIVLDEGWNCIGNPFSFPVFWNNTLIEYNGSLISITDSASLNFVRRQYFSYVDKTTDGINNGKYLSNRELISHIYNDSAKLNPWEAYWIYAEKDSIPIFLDPYPTIRIYNLPKKKTIPPKSWFVTFKIKNNISETPIVIGASESALDNYDYLDVPSPPILSSQVRAGLYHPEWKKKSTLYIADIINYREEGEFKWNLRIYFDEKEKTSLLFNEVTLPAGYLILRDSKRDSSLLLGDNSFYNILPMEGEGWRDIELIWTSGDFSSSLKKIEKFNFNYVCLGKNYKFTYTLPEGKIKKYPVSLEIYSINGKKIHTLVKGIQSAGYYTVNWFADNNNKASGIYFVKFQTTSYSKSEKLYMFRYE
ncbi:MAG: glycoside hydrolase family 9 protein, partial [Chitinispirillaceae bacterium]|nr:glycoside hydrolase family 9 protein [Chitinispirillaceae bacterium]